MPRAARKRPFISVLAGVNGAGKSSVGGAMLAEHGLTWFNPDSYARDLTAQLGLAPADANARAWEYGRALLQKATDSGTNHAFETTLGASTIREMLSRAVQSHDVSIWFCGLASADLHIERVRQRVASGGHDIPEAKIRERWIASRANLIKLLPHLARLQVFDNSAQAAPGEDISDPVLVLETVGGRMVYPKPEDGAAMAGTPEWARPILEAAIRNAELKAQRHP